MTRLTDEQLEAMEARVEAATPGPWNVFGMRLRAGQESLMWADGGGACWFLKDADGYFITHARTDVPALISEIRRLRGLVGALVLKRCPKCGEGLASAHGPDEMHPMSFAATGPLVRVECIKCDFVAKVDDVRAEFGKEE